MFKKVLPILFILFIIGCSIPDEFGIPSWTTKFRLVFLHDTYDANAIADTVGSFIASGDTLQFYTEISDIQTFDDITFDDTEIHSSYFSLEEIADSIIVQANGDPVGSLPNYPDIIIPIDITKDFESFEEFEEIKFKSGVIELTITNNTVFWLGDAPEGEPLMINVLDTLGLPLVEGVIFDNVPPLGGSVVGEISLADSIITNDIKIQLFGEGDITNDSTAVIDITASVQLDIQFIDIVPEYIINAQITSLQIDPIEGYHEVDLVQPEIVKEDSFRFTGNSVIAFEIFSNIETLTDFSLIAKHGSRTVALSNDSLSTNIALFPGPNHIEFSSVHGYNINQMLQIIPDGFDYEFQPFFGDGTVPYISCIDEISIDIYITADIQIETFEEEGIWIIPLEDGEIEITGEDVADFDSTMYNAYVDGTIIFKYWNTSGMELGFDLLASKDSTDVLNEIFNFEEPENPDVQLFRVPLMEITTDTTYGEYILDVTREELQCFLDTLVYIVPRINISSEGTHPWTGDITIQGDLVIEIKINNALIDSLDF